MSNMGNRNKPASFIKRLLSKRLTIPLAVLIFVLVLDMFTVKGFLDIKIIEKTGLISGYIPNILHFASKLVIVTLGMTLVIAASGGPDISVGAIMAVAASFCGLMLNGGEYRTDVFHSPLVLALFIGLIGGALCGAFNGILVAGLKLQPMIATLVLFTAGRSISKLITEQTIYISNPVYGYLGIQIPGIPINTTIIVSVVIIFIVVLFIKLTSFGLYVQSVGINGSSSRLVGLNSRVIKFMAFVICGILAGAAGLVESSSLAQVESSTLAKGIEMDAILAVALGGNMLGGGKFSIAGSVIGAYTIQFISGTLLAWSVPSDQLYFYKALIIIVIIILSSDMFKEIIKKLTRKRISKKISRVNSNNMSVGG